MLLVFHSIKAPFFQLKIHQYSNRNDTFSRKPMSPKGHIAECPALYEFIVLYSKRLLGTYDNNNDKPKFEYDGSKVCLAHQAFIMDT